MAASRRLRYNVATRSKPGKDIWLFGGGMLFRTLLDAQLVDTVEVGVMPVLLGDGIPMLAAGTHEAVLHLTSSKSLASGTLMAEYDVKSTPRSPGG